MTEFLPNKYGYKVLTPEGFKEFSGIRKVENNELIRLVFVDGSELLCTFDHPVFISDETFVPSHSLKIGDTVLSTTGFKTISQIICSIVKDRENSTVVYDLIDVGEKNRFYANDILVHNCEFLGKTNSLVDSMILRQKILDIDNNRITYQFLVDNDIRFYRELQPWKRYLVSIDTSMGVDGDFAAIEVFEFPGFYQVAEWKSDRLNQNAQLAKIKNLTDWMYNDIKKKGNKNPEIYWSLENNGSAEGFLCALRQIEDGQEGRQYIKRATLITENGNKRKGFTTTKITKPIACSQLKILFESNRFHIYSRDYLMQLSNFSANSITATSYSAAKGGHDDLISASLTIILMYLQCKDRYDLDFDIMPPTTDINKPDERDFDEFFFGVTIN